MRIVFLGTPEFAVPSLARLIESRHEVCFVVTQPSKARGRGLKVIDPPVKVLALENNLPVFQPASLKKEPLHEKVRGVHADVGIVVAYGKILPTELLAAPRLGFLNVHASLLPEYRGAAPIQRTLMDGRIETGVTIMKVIPELDAGPIVSQQTVEINEDDDARSLSHVLSVLGADLLLRALDDIEERGLIEGVDQDESLATYAAKITKAEGVLDWSLDSQSIMFRLRGLTPWPGLFTCLGDRRLRIAQAEPISTGEAAEYKAREDVPPGTVSAIVRELGFLVRTGDGHLLVTRLQPEGKAEMEAPAFLNGAALRPGQGLTAQVEESS